MIHKEGYRLVLFSLLISLVVILLTYKFVPIYALKIAIYIISLGFFIAVLQFFRNPKRVLQNATEKGVYAPVDGKVVTIEKVLENEYYKAERILVSIFMSPLNVHVCRYPYSGEITYSKYHEGKYLVAFHPKSSEENERTTVVLKNNAGELLYRQISGYVARRIVNYAKVAQKVIGGEDSGFIKFGSRLDLYFPLDAEIKVEIGQKVTGTKTLIGNFK